MQVIESSGKKLSFKSFLLAIILLELFLLGSGQFINIAGFSLRMLFFSTFVTFSLLLFTAGVSFQKKIMWFVLGYTVNLVFYSWLGLVNGASIGLILIDLKSLAFAYMVVPFYILIDSYIRVLQVRKIILFSGLIMSILFLTLLAALIVGILDFNLMYSVLSSPANDFMMNDGEMPRVFYKGMLFIGVAALFFYYGDYRFKRVLFLILMIVLILSFTRGFVVALFLTIAFMMILEPHRKNNWLKLILLIIFVAIIFPFYSSFIGDKSISDSVRYLQIVQVFEAINPVSILVGHGFGIGVPIRQVHMEIAYLEIFHKQGIFGLVLWLGFIAYLVFIFFKLKIYKNMARPFIASVFFVYFQSLTNPYINNPIGMSILLITFVVFLVLKDLEERARC